MKRLIFAAILIALLSTIATAVNAQYDEPMFDIGQPRWNAHAGAAWVLGDDARDDAEFIVGFGYERPIDQQGMWLGFSLDYIPVSTLDDDTVSLLPFLVYIKGMGILSDYRVWGALGIGTSWADDDIPEMQIDDGFNLAWTAQLGVDFNPHLFAQARYIAGSNPGDDAFLTTELGWRF